MYFIYNISNKGIYDGHAVVHAARVGQIRLILEFL